MSRGNPATCFPCNDTGPRAIDITRRKVFMAMRRKTKRLAFISLAWRFAGLVLVLLLSACSSVSRPETKLLGKWQADIPATKRTQFHGIQFEFFEDGSTVMNEKFGDGNWRQTGAGTFKFVDPSHVKTDFGWYGPTGTTIYEVVWGDADHVEFRTADGSLALARVK